MIYARQAISTIAPTAVLRQSVCRRLAVYDDINDAERLSVDPVMRQVVSGRAANRRAASTSPMARFETNVLTQPQNLKTLMALPGQWINCVRQTRQIKKLVLDLDSSVSETYDRQEGAASAPKQTIEYTTASWVTPW